MFLTRRGCFCFSPYILFPLLLGESDDTAVQAIVLFLTGISQSDSPIHSKHASHSLTDSSHCSLCTLLSFPQLNIKLKWDFFAQAVSFNKLLLLKSNLKPFLKDTGIVPMFLTLVLTQTCYDKIQRSKFYVLAKNPWYVKIKS